MKYRRWFVVAGALALVGLLVAGLATLYGSFSPRGYVADNYRRAAAEDVGDDAMAYTSKKVPSQVAREIGDAWQPADQYVDASGIYLRYADDAVVILPLAVGSLILVERLSTAYPRYFPVVGGYWGWGRGASVRGGGPGQGK
jgi:hypothetical protein